MRDTLHERRDTIEIRIYYEDTDCGGVVYYANYLKYFERARTEYLETRGYSVAGLMKQDIIFVVVHAEVDYCSPGRYGETLTVETSVSDITGATMTFSHVVREKISGRMVVKGSARLAATDVDGKARRLDRALITVLNGAP